MTNSPYVSVTTQPLLSLFALGEIAPVDAAAISYISTSGLQQTGINRDDLIDNIMHGAPLWAGVLETPLGRIANILLPCFDSELYLEQEKLTGQIVKALSLANHIGAKAVSFTGDLAGATDYGRAVRQAMGSQSPLPPFSTGRATTTAAVVLTIKKTLALTGRTLEHEQAAFLGLGEIGLTSLRLMLTCLPHPSGILLYDPYTTPEDLKVIQEELTSRFDFQGRIDILPSEASVPGSMYQAGLIVGAVHLSNVLDVDRLRPGTVLIDDPIPHCFEEQAAITRFEMEKDIVFTEGGILQFPDPIHTLVYRSNKEHHVDIRANPRYIGSCVFSGLLSARFKALIPTVGMVDKRMAFDHYTTLEKLGFEAADVHCRDYVLSQENIALFRNRFGRTESMTRKKIL